jgi:hypothetical protein
MRAMLRVLKIESYPIAIYSGDPTFVREEWARRTIQPRDYRRQSQRRNRYADVLNHAETRTTFDFRRDRPVYAGRRFARLSAGQSGFNYGGRKRRFSENADYAAGNRPFERNVEVNLSNRRRNQRHDQRNCQRSKLDRFRREQRGFPPRIINKRLKAG